MTAKTDHTMLGYSRMYCKMYEKYCGVGVSEMMLKSIIGTQEDYRPWYLVIKRHARMALCDDAPYSELKKELKSELVEMLEDVYSGQVEEICDYVDNSGASNVLVTFVNDTFRAINWGTVACMLLESYTYMREKEE